MKIFCLIQCSNLGGMEKVTLDSLSLLTHQGHEVFIFSLHELGDLKILAESSRITIKGSNGYSFAGLGNVYQVLREIKQFNPDRLWIVGHNYGSLVAAKISKVPSFISLHYHHCERRLIFWKFFYTLALRVCKKLHFVSKYIFSEVDSIFPNHDKVVVFPNMINAPVERLSKVSAQTSLGIPKDSFIVGNAGWLIHRKAFDIFLDVASIVINTIPNVHFIIAGDGDERVFLEQKAKNLEISGHIHFLGWLSDLEPFYTSIDLLLFNSRYDCLPTTPLEAMVREIPVVCSLTNGGLSEILRHGIDGFLISEQNVEELATEIIRLYKYTNDRKNVALNGRLQVERVCSSAQHLDNLNTFLELK